MPIFVLEYVKRYPTCFDIGRFRRMQTDGNACRCLTILSSVVMRLSLDGLAFGIIEAISLISDVLLLIRTHICCLYALKKNLITCS